MPIEFDSGGPRPGILQLAGKQDARAMLSEMTVVMKKLTEPEQADLKVRKNLGRGHLTANRLEEALETYTGILRDFPDDVESYLVLGDLYLASADNGTAWQLYSDALQLDPTNPEIERRLKLARSGETALTAEPVPTDPAAISRLLQRLTGSAAPISEQEIARAADLLSEIIHSANPAEQVSLHLDQIDRLLPALLELNIRQARADGRPDLAEALGNLQTNIDLQVSTQIPDRRAGESVEPVRPRFQGRVLVLTADEQKPSPRAAMLAAGLEAAGCSVQIRQASPLALPERPEVVITCNPHVTPSLLEAMAACTAARIPLIVDLDADYERLPVHDPRYPSCGLGTPERSRAYAASLLLANLVTVPSEPMAALLRDAGYKVEVMAPGWSDENPLWNKVGARRTTINIGWAGYPGYVEDIAQVRRVVIRVLREFPETQLVVASDPQVYQLFDSLPPNRRLFLPTIDAEDFPYLLGQVDIILAPLQNSPFNHTQSDQLLVEAGVKGIPWIASPMPAFAAWEEGGVIANSLEEWHTYLRQFVMDADLRHNLGQAGRRRADEREISRLRYHWLDAIEQVVNPADDSSTGAAPFSEKVNL